MSNKANTINKSRKGRKRYVSKKRFYAKRRPSGNLLHKDEKVASTANVKDDTVNHTVNGNGSLTTFNPRSDDNDTGVNEFLSHERKACELFNLVYSGELIPALPSRSWSLHYIDMPARCIVVSKVIIHFEIEMGFIPVHIKQIVFDEKMNYELFFLNAKASITNESRAIKTLSDLTHVITFVDNIKLCSGGPETILYANVNPECAYRDPQGRWRHNLCTLAVTNSDTCDMCLSLIQILQRNGKRNTNKIKRSY